MSKYLVIYGTRDGQTAKIGHAIAEEFRKAGAAADEFDARSLPTDLDLSSYDAVVAGGGIQAGGYPKPLLKWAARNAPALAKKPGAFYSVCLGILEKDNPKVQADVKGFVQTFMKNTGWSPADWRIFAGSLAYTRYGWLKKRFMRWIAGRAGGSTDMTRDHEYTDWNEVRGFARDLSSKWSRLQ